MKFTCTTHRVVCQPEVDSAADDLIRPNSSSRTLAFSPDWAEGRTPGGVGQAREHAHPPLGKQERGSAGSRGLAVELILIKNALFFSIYCYFDFPKLGLFLSSSL